MPLSLQLIWGRETALPSPRLSPDGAAGIDINPIYYSDATGNDIFDFG